MLVKKELEALAPTPVKARQEKHYYPAGIAFHDLPQSGKIVVVDVYSSKKGSLLFRFFSDGKNFITLFLKDLKGIEGRWKTTEPTQYLDSTPKATKEEETALFEFLGERYCCHIAQAIGRFVYNWNREKREKQARAKYDRMKRHMEMFPKYPKDLAKYCEDHVFQSAYVYISKAEKGKRKAVCSHCGRRFSVDSSVRSGNPGACPKCGIPITYRWNWLSVSTLDKAKICVCHRVDDQLLMRYAHVVRKTWPDGKPQYSFEDYFYDLFLTTGDQKREYCYRITPMPYYGADWCDVTRYGGNLDETFVYTNNITEVFGEKLYNVDLKAGIDGLKRPFNFRNLLDNLKNYPQAEYLFKQGLPILASSSILRHKCKAKNFQDITGLSKQYLPILRDSGATWPIVDTIAAAGKWVPPEDVNLLCQTRLEYHQYELLQEVLAWNSIGRTLRYLSKQRNAKFKTVGRLISMYRDYLSMADLLRSDMKRDAVLMPKNLKKQHDLLAVRVAELKDQLENEKIIRAIERGLYSWAQEFSADGFCVAYPMTRADFLREGQCLNHCVGNPTYYNNHVKGRNMIFFIRKADEPKKPFFTTEINVEECRIRQLYGFGDCSAPKEVREFTEKFTRAIRRWTKAERMAS